MITTRRSDTNSINAFGSDASRGGVALLERREPVTYKEYVAPETSSESAEEAKLRMQENLARLLNYDRYSEQAQDVASVAVTAEAVETVDAQASASDAIKESSTVSEDDIRPTSTTMQFGDGDIDNLRMDMKSEVAEDSVVKYRLNTRGKLVVILYALVLTVVMALIAINTGVLARLSATEQSASEAYAARVQTLSAIETETQAWKDAENISKIATEEYGMKLRLAD